MQLENLPTLLECSFSVYCSTGIIHPADKFDIYSKKKLSTILKYSQAISYVCKNDSKITSKTHLKRKDDIIRKI